MKFIGDFDGTLEDYITTLPAVTSIGTGQLSITASEVYLYDATNDGNPTISLGSTANERFEIKAQYESGAQGMDVVKFTTYTAGSSANDGRYSFFVDEVNILQIKDDSLNLAQSMNLSIGGVDILADSSGTTTLSNIDALDATTESTIEAAIDTLSNLTTVGTIGTGVWQGTAIAHAYIGDDAIEGDNIADNAINSEHYTDGSIDTVHIGDDQVTFDKALGVSPRVFGNTIKILPSDFMINDDAASPLSFKDGSNSGVHINDTANEAIAFVAIPEGMKATALDIHATHTRAISVYEVDLNASFDFTATADETGNCNTQITIDPNIASTATNYLAIIIALNNTVHRIHGGVLTIANQ